MNEIKFFFIENQAGILASLIAAIIFVYLSFLLFRPWFFISSRVAFEDNFYKFKIINFTFFKCSDVVIYLRRVREKDANNGGKDLAYKIIHQGDENFIYVSSIFSGFRKEKANCIQFKSNNDIVKIIEEDGTYVELILKVKHGLSGLTSIKKKTFKHKTCIKNGRFMSGFNTSIKSI